MIVLTTNTNICLIIKKNLLRNHLPLILYLAIWGCKSVVFIRSYFYEYFILPEDSQAKLKDFLETIKTRRGRPVTCDTSHATRDTWHVNYDMWHVTCDMWHVAGGEHSLKNSTPQLLRFVFYDILKIWRKRLTHWLTHWLN